MTLATAPPVKQTGSSPVHKTAHSLRWLGQFLAATVLIVAALEMTFALAGIGEEEYIRPDPVLGADGIPDKTITWRKEGFARLQYNRFGMQDRERSLDKPAGDKRVACLGDSLVEALQVDRQDNFCSLLEADLTNKTGSRWEVLNFGVSNSNLGQIYLRLKNKVWQFHPDVIAICIRPDAIFQLAPNTTQGFITARPTFFLGPNDTLIQDMTVQNIWERSREGKRMRATSWLREHSRTWGVVSKGVEQFAAWVEQAKAGTAQWGATVTKKETAFANNNNTNNKAAFSAPPAKAATAGSNDTNKNCYDGTTRFFWPLMSRLLREIKYECDLHQTELVIVRLPAYDGWRNELETQLLQEFSAKNKIAFINTQEQFAELGKTEPLFFKSHMRPAGHKIVAVAMFKQLLN